MYIVNSVAPVSYTHLDVYKRQYLRLLVYLIVLGNDLFLML